MNVHVRMTPDEALQFARDLTAAAYLVQEKAVTERAFYELATPVRKRTGSEAVLQVRIEGGRRA